MYGHYDPDHPIIVGLAGPAGSGKTSTADGIIKAEGAMWSETGDVVWDHLYHAMPLYEYAAIRLKTTGTDSKNRQLHMIHSLTQELLGTRVDYDDLIELVYDIYSMPIPSEGKPRSFLQDVGSMLRAYDPDCFARWAVNKAYQRFHDWLQFSDRNQVSNRDLEKPFVVLLSDVRLMNEVNIIKKQPNNFLIRLDASERVLNGRLFARDQVVLTDQQRNHESEAVGRSEEFINSMDLLIDTTSLSLEEQVPFVRDEILKAVGITRKVNA